MRRTDHVTLFHGAADFLSNWHQSPFMYRGLHFNCVEQFMMFSKAKMFADEDTAAQIMATKDPRQQKALGRAVKGYDETQWAAKRSNIVAVACREKFSQNPVLLAALLDTRETTIVEASPYDRIWGIGLGENDPRALDPSKWQGLNLLGITLMSVRSHLRQDATCSAQPEARMPARVRANSR